jgi:predicted GTPase
VIVPTESATSKTHPADYLEPKNVSAVSRQNVYNAEELVQRLIKVREAIEEQSVHVAELEEQFKSELRRVQVLRTPSETQSAVETRDDREPPHGLSH